MRSHLPDLGPRGEGWVLAQIVLFAAIGVSGFLSLADRPDGAATPVEVAGALAIVGGGIVVLSASWTLRTNLTPFPRPTAGATLVETGPFRWVRHPIYAGIVLAAVGWAAVCGSIVTLALAAVLMLLFDAKSRREEAWLVDRFPGYPGYRERTSRFIPRLY